MADGGYPAGAEYDSRAPYNQYEQEEVEVEVTVSTTLSRNTTIYVNDYTREEWEDWEPDGEGGYEHSGGVYYDFSDCNLKAAYLNQELTIPKLLEILKEYAKADMEGSFHTEGRKAKEIFSACEDWEEDELEVTTDE